MLLLLMRGIFGGIILDGKKRQDGTRWGGSPGRQGDRWTASIFVWLVLVWTLSGTSPQPETGKQPVDSRLAPSPAARLCVWLCVCVSVSCPVLQ